MNSPYVSVIVPCLNRKAWLQEGIGALRRQQYPRDRLEIIVVDNGSRDGAWEWLQEASKQDGIPLRCFRNDTPYKTHAGSRNVGLRHAQGEIIAFTDSDCMVSSDWIQKGVARFREGVGIVVGKTIPPPNDPVGSLSKVKVIENEGFFDTCNIFYTRQAVDRVGHFAEDVPSFSFMIFGDDSDLGLRVKEAGYESLFAEEAVVMHRVHQQTLPQWLIEPRVLLSVPYFVKKHPMIRKEMLFLRYFLTPFTALFDLLLLGLALAWWVSPWFALLGLPLLVAKMIQGGRHLGPGMRVVRAMGGCVRAGVIFLVLLYASGRYRCLVI